MICANCKKKIDEPLLLYNGSLTCPSCKKLLTAVDNFCITEENEELYRLSENMFFRSLTSSDKNKQRNYRLKADFSKLSVSKGQRNIRCGSSQFFNINLLICFVRLG